ncbi:MAG: hypothetical protein FWD42_07870 [Solirubrobacterales bacterium]|nr:hypothetical protein [Solirubrobacterales bacterium]
MKAALTLAIALSACVALAACGGSSPHTSTVAATGPARAGAASVAGAGGDVASAGAGRFAALRECLRKNGVAFPAHRGLGGAPGHRRPPGALLLGGKEGARRRFLPRGVSPAELRAAMARCGAGVGTFARRRLASPAFHQALASFAQCMRRNGVNVPPPNTSGHGPIFDTRGIDTRAGAFRSAEAHCRALIATGTPARGGG